MARNGVPAREFLPVRPRRLVPAETVLAAFRDAPLVDAAIFRRNLDRYLSHAVEPRA